MRLLWLDDPACQRLQLAGGKAANLSRLANTQQVPPGFCLTTAAQAEWAGTVADDGETGAFAVPSDLQALLDQAYTTLAQRTALPTPAVAVRSSAVAEDGREHSFAGQYATYLNVVGAADVGQAVLRCWRSASTTQVLLYQQRQAAIGIDRAREKSFAPSAQREVPDKPFPGNDSALAVLVQWLVPADIAFVAFSANPVSGERQEVMINANWGLGESIVSGLVTPDTYLLDKKSWAVRQEEIADKAVMTIVADAGVKTVPIPRLLRRQPVLNQPQRMAVAQLATQLEREFGYPVDIEGAYYRERLYLLQCRPISTLPQYS
jgi:pyruvate,water dikinase